MTRLKLEDIADDKPIRLHLEIPARLHRELLAYSAALNNGTSQGAPSPERLIPPMVEHFIANDRSFSRLRQGARRKRN